MTAVTIVPRADAPSHVAVKWHAIDWRKVLRNVRRLQARIVKATQAGKWHAEGFGFPHALAALTQACGGHDKKTYQRCA
jgi:hypothetical protein